MFYPYVLSVIKHVLTMLLNFKKNVFSLKMNSKGEHVCWRWESDLVGCWTSSAASKKQGHDLEVSSCKTHLQAPS